MKTIVIVGAGPGGLEAAIELGNNGYKVIVLEKNAGADYKVCAGGISLTDFNKYDFPPDLRKLIERAIVRKFGGYKIITPRQSASVGSDGQTAATLDRKLLNAIMAEEAEKHGAEIFFNERVTQIEGNFVFTASGHKYKFDYLIGADGSNSAVRKILKLGRKKTVLAIQYMIPVDHPEILFFIDKEKFGVSYGWVFPQAGRISVGTGKYSFGPDDIPMQTLRKNLDDWVKEKFGPEILEKAKFEAFPILVDYQGYEFGNIFLVGDAAGLANDLTGGGIISAIVSARHVARKIMDPGYKGQEIEMILKAKENSRKFLQLAASPVIGPALAEIFVFFLKIPFLRRRIGHALM